MLKSTKKKGFFIRKKKTPVINRMFGRKTTILDEQVEGTCPGCVSFKWLFYFTSYICMFDIVITSFKAQCIAIHVPIQSSKIFL